MPRLARRGAAALSVALFCAAAQSQWEMVGPYGGSATSIAVDPHDAKILLAGGRAALLYRSDNGGLTWRLLPFPRQSQGTVRSIVIDPANSKHYLVGVLDPAGNRGGLWTSADGGATWTENAALKGNSVEALAVFRGDPRRLAAGTRQGVWLSEDGGGAWRRVSPADNAEMRTITAVEFDPRDFRTLYAGTPHLPWKTQDNGANWHSIHTGMLDDSDVFSIYTDPQHPERVFASACSGIYRSQDAAATWTKFAGIPGELRRTHVIRQNPHNPEVLYAGTTMGLLRSVDGGKSWKQTNQHSIHWLAVDPTNARTLYIATERTGVMKSIDGGETFQLANVGFVSRKVNQLTLAGGRMFANALLEGESRGLYISDDEGRSWRMSTIEKAPKGLLIQSLAGSLAADRVLLAATDGALVRSLDAGRTWLPVRLAARAQIRALATVWRDNPVLLAATDAGLYRSADAGKTWRLTKVGPHASDPVLALYPASGRRPEAAVRLPAGLYMTADAGLTWRRLGTPVPPSSVYDISFNGKGITLAATTDGLFRHTLAGWDRVQGLPAGTVTSVVCNPQQADEAFAVQFGRLYRSADAGRKWWPVAAGYLEAADIRALWMAPGRADRLFALTADIGILYLNLLGI